MCVWDTKLCYKRLRYFISRNVSYSCVMLCIPIFYWINITSYCYEPLSLG